MTAHLVNAAKRIKKVSTANGQTFNICLDCGCWDKRINVTSHDCACHHSQQIITDESE